MGSTTTTADNVVVAVDAGLDQPSMDLLCQALPWITFRRVASLEDGGIHANVAVAAGPGVFLLEALEAGLPIVVPTSEETRRYMGEGGGVLTAPTVESIAEGVRRIAVMAPAARRVMGRIGRQHLLSLVS